MKLKNLIALILCAVVLLTNVVPGTLAFGSDEETDGEPVTVIGEVAGDTVITVGSDEEQEDGNPAEAPGEDSEEPAAEPEQPADADTDNTENADEPRTPEEPDDTDDPADAEEPAEDGNPEEPQASEPAEKTLTANSVTVTGVLPEDTELVAERISDPLASKSGAKSGGKKTLSPAKADMLGFPDRSSGDVGFDYVDSLDDDWEAAAFYDIKLLKSGEALQPEETVTVTIENVPLKFTGPVSVKHFLDSEEAILAGIADGTVTAVKNAAYASAFPEAAAAAAAATGRTGFVFVETITERDGLTVQGSTVSFPAKSFSIYAIGEGQEPSEYRLHVIFHRADGTTVSMLVKQDDIGMIDTVVYDPGEGTPPEGKVFRGWTTIENYNSATPVKDIDGIRAEIIALLNSGVTDMQKLDVWAMLLDGYTVTYLDERDVKINEIAVFYTEGNSAPYTIEQSYIPINQDDNFRGWELVSGTGISAYPSGKDYYPNGTSVTISGNVVLKASVEEGNWIIFNENGKGASYTPPQFVRSGTVSVEPEADPVRLGYTFGGWYTNQACTDGNEFSFGGHINTRTEVFAKWIAVDTADYTVIIWRQNIDGDGYDFEESVTLNGDVGSTIDTIVAAETGNNRHAVINGVAKQYVGFHLVDVV